MSMLSRFATTGGGITDPYWTNVVLLVTGDGTSGSTTFTDLSNAHNAITNINSTSVNTSIKYFGTGSISVNGTQELAIGATNSFNFNTGNFTIECWANQTSKLDAYPCLINFNGPWAPNAFELQVNTNDVGNKFCFSGNNGAGNILVSTTLASFGTWFYVAIVRNGNTLLLFVNGTLEATASYTGNISGNINTSCNIGGISGKHFNGYIDEIRITKGIARYTSSFTTPTQPFPTS